MATVCDKCGYQTEVAESFIKRRKSFSKSIGTYCPRCYSEFQLSVLKRQLWWNSSAGLIGLVFVLALPKGSGGWILLNLFLFQLFLFTTILPHELGHACAARWLGLRVFKIHVGSGKTLFTRNIFGFDTEFKAVPIGGLTLAAHRDSSSFRLKQAAYVFAGPLVNILLCASVFLFVPFQEIWSLQNAEQRLVPFQAFFYANLIVLAANLWPAHSDGPIGKIPTDGKQLWEILFLKPAVVDANLAACFALEAMNSHEKNHLEEALSWVAKGLSLFPQNDLLQNWRGLLLIELKHYESARECFMALLARDGNPPLARGQWLNNIAYVDALLELPELLPEADRFSQEAMSIVGWLPAVKGTRGTTLMEMGRIDEAMPLLRESMEQADNSSGKAQNACFISIGEARCGNLAESRQFLDEARRLEPDCFLLDRAEEALRLASIHP